MSISDLNQLYEQLAPRCESITLKQLGRGSYLYITCSAGRAVEISESEGAWWIEFWDASDDEDAAPAREVTASSDRDAIEEALAWCYGLAPSAYADGDAMCFVPECVKECRLNSGERIGDVATGDPRVSTIDWSFRKIWIDRLEDFRARKTLETDPHKQALFEMLEEKAQRIVVFLSVSGREPTDVVLYTWRPLHLWCLCDKVRKCAIAIQDIP